MTRSRFITLLLFAALALSVHARSHQRYGGLNTADNYHFFYVSGCAGYTMLSTTMLNSSCEGQWKGNFGLGYEFRNNGLWSSVGLQLGMHGSTLRVDDYLVHMSGAATNRDEVTLQYAVQQVDEHQWKSLDIPVMVGYYKYGFYVGGGLKLGYYLSPKVRSHGQFELSGTHNRYGIEFKNMPNHGYTMYDYDQTHVTKLRPQLALIGEIGYDLLSSVPTRSAICNVLKLGFYFEYGLNSMVAPSSSSAMIAPVGQDATNVNVFPCLNTGIRKEDRVVPFLTGIKLTYVIGGSRTAHRGVLHHGCMCYQ